jgi:Domain of unknown function (DUF4382)
MLSIRANATYITIVISFARSLFHIYYLKKPIMKNTTRVIVCIIILSGLYVTACKKSTGNSRLTVALTDDPSIYDSVDIDIQSIQVNTNSDTSKGWTSLPITRQGVYNLLDFRNGLDTLLTSTELPAGTVSQIRLILGSNNAVVIGGTRYHLETPSDQQSGLKLNVHATLLAGIEYKLWIDFDASRSIVETGAGSYILKPVIRTYTEATSGAIKGSVVPADAHSIAYAIQNTDTIGSAIPDITSGNFLIGGLPAGDYNVSIHPESYADTTIAASVATGTVTDVGTVQLHQ